MSTTKELSPERNAEPVTMTAGCTMFDVSYRPGEDNRGARSDLFHFSLRPSIDCSGQPLMVNGESADRLDFTVRGEWEVEAFFSAMVALAKAYRSRAL